MDINNPTIYSLNPNIMYTLIDGEAVILGKENQLFATNAIATKILQFIEAQPSTVAMIHESLIQIFDVNEQRCLVELDQLIEQFIINDVITCVE